jgi:hypothetical protein
VIPSNRPAACLALLLGTVLGLSTVMLAGCSGDGGDGATTGSDGAASSDTRPEPQVNPNCPRDNLICPNGTIVMRTGVDCEFVCPEDDSPQAQCDYAAPDRRYFSRYAQMCSQIPPVCQSGESYFNDACGCGCTTR